VLGASLADIVVLPAQTDQGEVWVAVDAADLGIAALDSLDLTRPSARVSAEHVFVPADRIVTGLAAATVTALAATLFSAEACGIADWAVHTAADYAKIRIQFGRPIGQFQAVKHRCAWMLTVAEQAAATVWDAARAQQAHTGGAEGRESEFAAAAAAVVAIDAAVSCTHECIQVLGGIGYTWEHDAHLYYRRALSLRALLGPSGEWAQRVAALALDGVSRPMQVDLPAAAEPLRAQIRDELAAIAALEPAARTEQLASGGRRPPPPPRAGGAGGGATGAGHHRAGNEGGPGARPGPRHRRLGGSGPGPVRDARAAGAVPAAHPARRDHLVPAVQRTRSRLRPRGAVHPRRAREGG